MSNTINCPHCTDTLKNERGLAIHIGRIHKNVGETKKVRTTKTTKNKSRSNGSAELVKKIEVSYDHIDITTDTGKQTFAIEPSTLLHILSSAKSASKEYVESL